MNLFAQSDLEANLPEGTPFAARWPQAPTTADAYRMGGLAAMDQYAQTDPRTAYGAHDKARAEQFKREAEEAPWRAKLPASLRDIDFRPAGEADKLIADFVVPQTPLDVGLMVAGGPVGGKALRVGAGAMGALFDPDEAQAGTIDKIAKRIRAYHSSPHDFDRFDASKIGTGEGAQVYGHGLYFAENPAVSGQGGQYWNQFLHRFPKEDMRTAEFLKQHNFNRDATIAEIKRQMETTRIRAQGSPGDFHSDNLAHLQRRLDLLESGRPVGPRTYEVDIKARPELFLDWDKPIGQQKAYEQLRSHWDAKIGDPDIVAERMGVSPDAPGGRLHSGIGGLTQDRVATANMLREAGIPGIRYLDQGSRAARPSEAAIEAVRASIAKKEAAHAADPWLVDPKNNTWGARNLDALNEEKRWLEQMLAPPTSNYVVFDPGIVDIVKKYGVVGAPAGMGMGALAAQDDYRQ